MALSEQAGIAAAALSAVRELLLWNERVALDGPLLATVFTLLTPLVVAALVLLVTRRRKVSALFVLVGLLALAWLTTAKLGLTDGSVAFSVGAVSLLLQTASVVLMVLPISWRWLRAPRHG